MARQYLHVRRRRLLTPHTARDDWISEMASSTREGVEHGEAAGEEVSDQDGDESLPPRQPGGNHGRPSLVRADVHVDEEPQLGVLQGVCSSPTTVSASFASFSAHNRTRGCRALLTPCLTLWRHRSQVIVDPLVDLLVGWQLQLGEDSGNLAHFVETRDCCDGCCDATEAKRQDRTVVTGQLKASMLVVLVLVGS